MDVIRRREVGGVTYFINRLARDPAQTEVWHSRRTARWGFSDEKAKKETSHSTYTRFLPGRPQPGWGAGRKLLAPCCSHLLPLPARLPRNWMRHHGVSPTGTSPELLRRANEPGPAHFTVREKMGTLSALQKPNSGEKDVHNQTRRTSYRTRRRSPSRLPPRASRAALLGALHFPSYLAVKRSRRVRRLARLASWEV